MLNYNSYGFLLYEQSYHMYKYASDKLSYYVNGILLDYLYYIYYFYC